MDRVIRCRQKARYKPLLQVQSMIQDEGKAPRCGSSVHRMTTSYEATRARISYKTRYQQEETGRYHPDEGPHQSTRSAESKIGSDVRPESIDEVDLSWHYDDRIS